MFNVFSVWKALSSMTSSNLMSSLLENVLDSYNQRESAASRGSHIVAFFFSYLLVAQTAV